MTNKLFVFILCCSQAGAAELNQTDSLGKSLFHDVRLSEPAGQSCASCHSSKTAFTDPSQIFPTSKGITGHYGSRNAPTLKYLGTIPPRTRIIEAGQETYQGGLFWDGRVDTLEQQTEHPLLNPIEMNNPDKMSVVKKVREGGYQTQFDAVFGKGALADDKRAFGFITAAITAYLRSAELNAFNSKYDNYLAGKAELSEKALKGLELFEDENKGNCAACHPSRSVIDQQTGFEVPPVFTDFTYDNLGVPFNPNNRFLDTPSPHNPYGKHFIDRGLGLQDSLKNVRHYGKFKVPTLRNVELTAPYMHNGAFTTLKEAVDFYNTRDVDDKWGRPEVASTVNTRELGDLKLTDDEVEAIVEFLKTLTDG